MNDIQKAVYKVIAPKTPRQFRVIRQRTGGYRDFGVVERALQALRRAGKIKHLKKVDGGPGWVRA